MAARARPVAVHGRDRRPRAPWPPDPFPRATARRHTIHGLNAKSLWPLALNGAATQQKWEQLQLRAQRKWGELYASGEKAKGATVPGTNRGMTRSDKTTASPTLAKMGVTKNEASAWQKLAAVPETGFEAELVKPDFGKLKRPFSTNSERTIGTLLKTWRTYSG